MTQIQHFIHVILLFSPLVPRFFSHFLKWNLKYDRTVRILIEEHKITEVTVGKLITELIQQLS